MILNKKAQEEIVGFVVIVVLVAVVFLVFLGITLRKPAQSEGKSEIAYQFLESSMEQTTDCSIFGRDELLSLEDLISECFSSDSLCDNGLSSCESMNLTVNSLLDSTWFFGNDYPLKGYFFGSYYSLNNSQSYEEEKIIEILKGNCNGTIIGNSYWSAEFPGSITTTFKLCY